MDKSETVTRIGVVDDDLSVRRAFSRLLRSRSYKCLAYESAEAALADPDFFRVDCLVLDLELPGMSGFELRDRLTDLGSKIPCLFVTAHAKCDFPDWTLRMKDSLNLRKPIVESELLLAIDTLVNGHH
jgi:FixJ family two-component response regulator